MGDFYSLNVMFSCRGSLGSLLDVSETGKQSWNFKLAKGIQNDKCSNFGQHPFCRQLLSGFRHAFESLESASLES